jgi:hypothetical protein
MAAHRGKNERLHAARNPVPRDRSRHRGDIRNAPAAHSDGYSRAGLQIRAEICTRHFVFHGTRDIGQLTIGEILAN